MLGLQGKHGLPALAVGRSDRSPVTLLGLKHLDVRTFLSEASACPDLSPIMRNEQQRLMLFNAEPGLFRSRTRLGRR